MVESSFSNNIDEAYKLLDITDEESKMEFLELIYSIEITQSDVEDFWNFYQVQNNITLTDEDKASIRMNIRTDVVKNLSRNFYKGLANDLCEGKIKDLETMFYMMRLWELDCCNHLNYTNKQELEHAKSFLIWQDDIEKIFLQAISDSNNLSMEELLQKFDDYHMTIANGQVSENNADFSSYDVERSDYLNYSLDSYSTTYFAKVSTVVDYINTNSKTK